MRLISEILRDTRAIARGLCRQEPGARELMKALSYDATLVLALSRVRQAAERWKVPGVNGMLRRVQTALFGVEIARDVVLGEGVLFLHTVGVVIGGDARIGDRVVFLGSNTIGSVGNKGYPRIGDDVVIGAGARILGSVTIGSGASIGANAVVLVDVPPGAVAVGVPAVVRGIQTEKDAAQASEAERAASEDEFPARG
jgi:serine O-acetyltransferase